MPLRRLVAAHDHIFAVLQGHLHADRAYRVDGRVYLVAPALGPSRTPALKHVLVHRDRLIFRTIARDPATGSFGRARGIRVVPIPEELRAGLRRPAGEFVPEHPSEGPRDPRVDDPALAGRKAELLGTIGGFLDRDVRPGM